MSNGPQPPPVSPQAAARAQRWKPIIIILVSSVVIGFSSCAGMLLGFRYSTFATFCVVLFLASVVAFFLGILIAIVNAFRK